MSSIDLALVAHSTSAALDALQSAVGRQKHARAVQAKYGRDAPSQEAAAETLGVPLSSFRRHLKSGVEFIVEYLWQREDGGRANQLADDLFALEAVVDF